jgi:hypothetical protein
MRIVRRHCDLVNEAGAQSLDGPPRCLIVRITGNDNGVINGKNEWRDGPAGLKGVTMTTKRLLNPKSNVACADSNMVRIADAKIDMTDLRAVGSHYKEFVRRHKTARRLTRHNPDKSQRHLAGGQSLRWNWQRCR